MFKRALACCLALALTAGCLSGCGPAQTEQTAAPSPSSEQIQSPPVQTVEPTPSPDVTVQPSPLPSADDLSDDEAEARRQAMLPIVDALGRCLSENGLDYAPRDPGFFWVALYYAISNYGTGHPLVQQEEWGLQAPYQVVQEYAGALFADYSDLLEIPEMLNSSVWYDDDWGAYGFSAAESSPSTMNVDSWLDSSDGSYQAAVTLTDAWGESHSFQLTLVDNPYVSGITSPTFYYTVSDIRMQ